MLQLLALFVVNLQGAEHRHQLGMAGALKHLPSVQLEHLDSVARSPAVQLEPPQLCVHGPGGVSVKPVSVDAVRWERPAWQ